MQRGERVGRDEVIDRSAERPRATHAFREIFSGNLPARAIGFTEESAFRIQRCELQQLLYVFGRHSLPTISLIPNRNGSVRARTEISVFGRRLIYAVFTFRNMRRLIRHLRAVSVWQTKCM